MLATALLGLKYLMVTGMLIMATTIVLRVFWAPIAFFGLMWVAGSLIKMVGCA